MFMRNRTNRRIQFWVSLFLVALLPLAPLMGAQSKSGSSSNRDRADRPRTSSGGSTIATSQHEENASGFSLDLLFSNPIEFSQVLFLQGYTQATTFIQKGDSQVALVFPNQEAVAVAKGKLEHGLEAREISGIQLGEVTAVKDVPILSQASQASKLAEESSKKMKTLTQLTVKPSASWGDDETRMLKDLFLKKKVRLRQNGIIKEYELPLDQVMVETQSEMTDEQARQFVRAFIPGGVFMARSGREVIAKIPSSWGNISNVAALPQSGAFAFKGVSVTALGPVLYEAGGPQDASTRRTVSTRLLVKESTKLLAKNVADQYKAGSIQTLPFGNFSALIFGSPFQALAVAGTICNVDETMDVEIELGHTWFPMAFTPNDPLYPNQWHLKNNTSPNYGVNVSAVWTAQNSPGQGNRIAVVDTALEYSHEDLLGNAGGPGAYGQSHWDFIGNDFNTLPDPSDPVQIHGTEVAGCAAAVGGNGLGVTGVAPFSQLLGVRLVGGSVTDSTVAAALTYGLSSPLNVGIYNNSWGPSTTVTDLSTLGPVALSSIEFAVNYGRGGKGAIYLWAAGNDRESGGYANNGGMANFRQAIAVGAIGIDGHQADYSNSGGCLLVSAPSQGTTSGTAITTTDLMGANGYSGSNYTSSFNGTSAATPLVAGVVSLILQANPNLNWRDVQEILIRTAKRTGILGEFAFRTNGTANTEFRFSESFGAGLVDASAAVALASTWGNLPPLNHYSVTDASAIAIPDQGVATKNFNFGSFVPIRVERVEVVFNAATTYRGDLKVEVISPSGMTAQLTRSHGDSSNMGYRNWVFTSPFFWGEQSNANGGVWKVRLSDMLAGDLATFLTTTVSLYGSGPASFSFPNSSFQVWENAGTVSIPVARNQGGGTATVTATTSNGPAAPPLIAAVSGTDYMSASGTVTFTGYQNLVNTTVNIIDTGVPKYDRNFTITLSAPSVGYTIASGADSAVVTILDTNSARVGFASSESNYYENEGTRTVTVRRTQKLSNTVTIDYTFTPVTAYSGAEYTNTTPGGTLTGGTLTFAPGETSKTISIAITPTTTLQPDKLFYIQLSNAQDTITPEPVNLNSIVQHAFTILDDHGPGARVSAETIHVSKTAPSVDIPLEMANMSGKANAVNYWTEPVSATPGQDYTPTSGQVLFLRNQGNRSIKVPLLPGAVAGTTFELHISSPSVGRRFYPNTTTITIDP